MIVTQHNNNQRTGANLGELQLTTASVSSGSFGKMFERFVDGSVYAQPLVVPNLAVGDPKDAVTHNVVFVATMHNSVFAFDSDDPNQAAALWQRHLASSIQLPTDDVGDSSYRDIEWEVGIVGTPVIDTDRGALYCVTTSRQEPHGIPIHQLWRLDLATGAGTGDVVIAASFGPNGFHSHKQLQRPALLLVNDRVYVAFASYGDYHMPFHGWVLAYDADTLDQRNVFCSTVGGANAGIWQAGQGPAADDSGNLYFMTGNGDFDPGNGDFGDSVMKLSPTLGVLDFFSPHNTTDLNSNDLDLGSGGVLIVPDSGLICGGGKEAILYLLSQSALGGYDSTDHVVQKVQVSPNDGNHHIHGSPVLWAGPSGPRIYVWTERDFLKAYSFDGTHLSSIPVSQCTIRDPDNVPGGNDGMPGGFLSISADGANAGTGIVWANHPFDFSANQLVVPGVLRAFDAEDLTNELWDSRQTFARDDLGNFAKFCPPTVANGKVYQATMGGLQQKQTLSDRTMGSPQLVSQADARLVLAWTGTDSPGHLNVMTSPDGMSWSAGTKFTIPAETTSHSPGVAFDAATNTTFLAWTGTDAGGHINIQSSTANDLRTWVNKQITSDRSGHAPALVCGAGKLFVAWTGLDNHLNVAVTNDGGGHWDKKQTLYETSNTQPWISFIYGRLVLCWQGMDERLNFLETTDLANLAFVNKVTIGDTSGSHPSVALTSDGMPILSWTGTDGHLNQIVAATQDTNGFSADPNYKRTFHDTSPNGPSLCQFQGRVFITWQGSDSDHHINVGVLNRGSVVAYGLLGGGPNPDSPTTSVRPGQMASDRLNRQRLSRQAHRRS